MKRFLFAIALLAIPALANAADYFQQDVAYTIKASLDTKQKILSGDETIVYTNNSPDTIAQLYLHLYPNGYRSTDSELIKDFSRRFNVVWLGLPKKYQGYLDIRNVTVDGTAVEAEIDDTIARFDLPRPLLPAGTITVALQFEEKIRRHIGRAGYRGSHYDFAQWYPKVVVYDENGFHPDKFRAGEFYGEFGSFDVHIELPSRFVVAATGTLQSGDPGWDLNSGTGKTASEGTKTVHFRAENVHDFAWCADPNFVVQDTTVAGVEIRSFYRKSNKAWKDSTLAHGVRAIKWLKDKVGTYPYPQVSIVDALLGGGMEYPMLVMDGRVSESLVLHEIGHIYFFGILGNDERQEAWLDEGFTTFQTLWYQIEKYGEQGITTDRNWYQRITPQLTELEETRARVFPVLRKGYGERVATPSHEFKNDYYTMVYRKAALMFFALRYVVGDEVFDKALTTYYDRWKLKHVNEERFKEVCEEAYGQDLEWFFEQWLHTRKICDYRVVNFSTSTAQFGEGYTTTVRIERRGEIVMPLKLVFTFADGSSRTAGVEGRLRTINESFDFPEKPVKVAINPDNEIADINLADNFAPRLRRFGFDWPNNNYFTENSYYYRLRPSAWYNDVDGLKAGFHLSGSYANWFKRVKLGIYYGAESERLDFSMSYAKPFRLLGRRSTLSTSGYKMEGRRDFGLTLRVDSRAELIKPPTRTLWFGINYHELTNTRYLSNPETYQTEPEFAPFFFFAVDPQFDVMSSRFKLGVRLGRDWFGADYRYTKFSATAAFKTRSRLAPAGLFANLRLHFDYTSGSMPFQQKASLFGGGPLAEEKRFFLRSPGAVWDELHYHEPGGGNLRGYRKGTFGVNRLGAINLEIGRSLPLLSSKPTTRLGIIKVYGFLDVGKIFDEDNPIGSSARVQALTDDGVLDRAVVDAGIGVTLERDLYVYKLFARFDMPFYVNEPIINAESKETDFRYVFSLGALF